MLESPRPDGPPSAAAATESALGPLRTPAFRMLWLAWMAANTTMWMNDVAAAWIMTSIGPSPLWVALVQTASTLPVFLLGLPSGAMADITDRKRFFMFTQFWVAVVATVLSVVVVMGWTTPTLLLALTFANGIGLAMRWPVFSALVPEVVERRQLPQALALNGMAMNSSRIVGPLLAGVMIASVGTSWVFAANAVIATATAVMIMRWRREHKESPLGRERLASAIRVGAQYVWQTRRLRSLLLRIALLFGHASVLVALLPLIAKALPDGGGAGTFTLLMAFQGVGAIGAVLMMPRIRAWLPTTTKRVVFGATGQALACLLVAFAPTKYLAFAAMALAGMSLITAANSLAVAAQMVLPDWVRARGMAIYQMCLMGSTAVGAALWGQIATWTSVHQAVAVAAASNLLLTWLVHRSLKDRAGEEDITPSTALRVPTIQAPPGAGRVQVQSEYIIDPARADEFRALMQESRRARLRQGALDWKLLSDIYQPDRYIEQVIDESWTEHLRRFDRTTEADVKLRDRKLAFHIGSAPPRVTRCLIEDE